MPRCKLQFISNKILTDFEGKKGFIIFRGKLGNHNHSVQQGTPFFHESLFFVCLWINLMHFGPFCYLQNHYILLNKVSTVQCTGPSGFTIESLIEYLIAANPVLERYSIWTKSHQGMSINDVPRFLAIFDLPTYLVLLYKVRFWGLSSTPLPTLISDVIN